MMSDADARPAGLSSIRHDASFAERRKSTRYALRDARGSMSWQGQDGDIASEVSVLNISGGGAAVLADKAPEAGRALLLSLHGDSRMEPIAAVAQASSLDASGKYFVRLRFTQWVALDSILEKHRERRMWARYPARESRASLIWGEGIAERTTHGDLLNISGGGAAFVADLLPPPGTSIRFRLHASVRQDDPIDPVESRLVATSVDPSGSTIAHIQFIAPCAMDLFELAVNGSR